ncbi:TetR/AcrR family transcriptional regulator [Mycobacterium sp. Aquia_216]|uniref:TetR/AcrR family transcriptional regulator n=1 Tax=Mycobacterium sp. Aquia_216 TaxID=2991729 RepID=UPI00227A9BF2|nr:TetR/AcrR family transcriptional regulator [Mycobacterium sp. Aquia_216]WAJ44672.1 TetR/AcrR family transcriptional regulator [Mycobacterium sp. Aquia_216]
MGRPNYHHGDLRAVILGEAARLVAERGADQVSLRQLARGAGVSHAAPAHHFVDRRGLFTALAAQGFELLARALKGARGHFADAALAYVRFALEHPGHYQVMFNRSLLDAADTALAAAQAAAGAELARGVATLRDANAQADPEGAQLAAWSLVHGFSTLWLNDAVNAQVKSVDPMLTVTRIATMLFEG